MKYIILALSAIFTISLSSFAQEQANDSIQAPKTMEIQSATLVEKFAGAYNNGHFDAAIGLLEKEKDAQLENGVESANLYYNLGNAYFRANHVAKALLYYEKALVINPGDRDTRHNIEYANTKIEDKIVEADTFFLGIWLNNLQNMFASNTWSWVAVTCFLLLIGGLFFFFFSKSIFIKKAMFYVGIGLIIFIIAGNIFAYRQKMKVDHRNTAIVMAGSAIIRTSPDANSKETFTLHSGTKVTVTKEDRNWFEIEIASGSVGWVEKDKVEVI